MLNTFSQIRFVFFSNRFKIIVYLDSERLLLDEIYDAPLLLLN